jgi:hypothetical protein
LAANFSITPTLEHYLLNIERSGGFAFVLVIFGEFVADCVGVVFVGVLDATEGLKNG